MAAIRYLTKDVARSIAFYTEHLGFKLDHRAGPAFASVSKGDLILWLSGPGSSGARPEHGNRALTPIF
jgi:glyoxylase I family protein